jgi:hypothetical protein
MKIDWQHRAQSDQLTRLAVTCCSVAGGQAGWRLKWLVGLDTVLLEVYQRRALWRPINWPYRWRYKSGQVTGNNDG